MSGLDKMKAQIIAEAQDNAKEILAQAHGIYALWWYQDG